MAEQRAIDAEIEASEAVLEALTTSAYGLLLKMMAALSGHNLEELRVQVEDEARHGDVKDRLVAALLVDLERLAEREDGVYTA